jgi:hypothetical protein
LSAVLPKVQRMALMQTAMMATNPASHGSSPHVAPLTSPRNSHDPIEDRREGQGHQDRAHQHVSRTSGRAGQSAVMQRLAWPKGIETKTISSH